MPGNIQTLLDQGLKCYFRIDALDVDTKAYLMKPRSLYKKRASSTLKSLEQYMALAIPLVSLTGKA